MQDSQIFVKFGTVLTGEMNAVGDSIDIDSPSGESGED
jgi:hypothetical protein